ncbi:hypothetical protein P171DRAFT_8922 [Karstenula rhodostoma CBS 690.94]|uniref:Copper transport protein n=1 Tax=Karstenula rhodostoma CBS 690.94 TaxID=1392251 RepID=A0A9P4UGY1_9PLEO|nr:hypothetical protein P171DRAFT_8922 [Karstenula rhodostoma CBS 690.94]
MDATSQPSLDTVGATFGLLTSWALRTPTSYGIAIVLLFTLGLLGRFLGAIKWQLERSWRMSQRNTNMDHRSYLDLNDNDGESQPLSPEHSLAASEKRRQVRQFWSADEDRNMKQDGIRALLEFARAVIAYILMLAVMTYDVGFFFSITASVLAGEFLLGRYSRSSHE